MFLDLSVLCLVLVVAKRFLAPSLQISHKTLMGLRLNSRAGRVLGIYGFFFPPHSQQSSRISCCSDHDLADAAMLLPFSSFGPHASTCSCCFRPCSAADLARSFLRSNVCIFFTFRLHSCESVYPDSCCLHVVTIAINRWLYSKTWTQCVCVNHTGTSSDLQTSSLTWCQNCSFLFLQLLLNIHTSLQDRNSSVHKESLFTDFFNF